MDHRMRVTAAPILLLLLCSHCSTFIPGADGPISNQEALEGGNSTFHCDSSAAFANDKLMLLVWYKDNSPIYSFDARIETEWSSDTFNTTGRLKANVTQQPTTLTVTSLREDDQAIYHCRVDFVLSQTRNVGVNLTVVGFILFESTELPNDLYKMFYLNNCVQVLPSQPFFLDEFGNKVEDKIGPYHEGDTLVLSCLVIGGRPPPRISWYSGDTLVDASDGESDIPRVKENELYLPLTRENAASLSCRASNTNLRPPIAAYLNIELYLPAQDVSIHLVSGTGESSVQAGRTAVVQCTARGSYPAPDLAWWLDRRHLTHHSNQSWSNATGVAVSFLELTPSVSDNEATLACVATNPAMAPSRGSKADLIKLNVTFSPLVEISRVGDGNLNEVVELDPLHLECEVKANPSAQTFIWYFNDSEIKAGGAWGDKIHSQHLVVEEATRVHSGRYSCAAANSIGETRAEQISITVLYPPECAGHGVTLVKESINCNIRALPAPDTFFWHIQPAGFDMQQLTTGSPNLPLGQITGPLVTHLAVTCEAGNGIASQEEPCKSTINLDHLRPPQPTQCDLAYEYEEFQVRCIPVENATHYEVSVWRMSTSNASLVLTRRASMGFGGGQALASGGAVTAKEPGGGANTWLVRGAVGTLREGDEAGASACNRYGCSRALLLRPTNTLLYEAAPPWWHLFLSRDVGISAGAVLLVVVFVATSALAVRAARRRAKPPPPVIQVLQLDEVARDYFDAIGEQKVHAACSVRSCSSGYSECSGSELSSVVGAGVERSLVVGASVGGIGGLPLVDRRRKPRRDAPPPDVTLTLHRESAV